MLLMTIFSELMVTFAPSWMVTRTGREEKVTPANLSVWGSEVGTCPGEGRGRGRREMDKSWAPSKPGGQVEHP